jgi:Mg2+ and Co2+ transporter CorA
MSRRDIRIYDSLGNLRDLLSSILNSYLTQASNRLGMATKTLRVVATVTLPIPAGLKWRKLL